MGVEGMVRGGGEGMVRGVVGGEVKGVGGMWPKIYEAKV